MIYLLCILGPTSAQWMSFSRCNQLLVARICSLFRKPLRVLRPTSCHIILVCPKVIAMTASPAGELSVEGTVMKLEELLGRLGATFAAPVETIEDVSGACQSYQGCSYFL